MKFKTYFLAIAIFTFISCKNKEFYRSNQVINFIQSEGKLDSSKESLFVFLTGTSSGCKLCDQEILLTIDSLMLSRKLAGHYKCIVITDRRLTESELYPGKDVDMIVKREYDIQKRGIDMPYDLIIEIDSKREITYWNWLHVRTIEDIKRYFYQ